MTQFLNNSQLTQFRTCPYKWGIHYVERLVPDTVRLDARDWGSIYHLAQQALWTAQGSLAERKLAAVDALNAEMKRREEEVDEHERIGDIDAHDVREEMWEIQDWVVWAIGHYRKVMERELSRWEVLGCELKLGAKVGRGVVHEGTIDLIAYDPLVDQVFVVDHKSTSGSVAAYEGRLQLDTQHVGYTVLVEEAIRAGKIKHPKVTVDTPVSFAWHTIRSKIPTEPSINLLQKGECVLQKHTELLAMQKEEGVPQGRVSVKAIDTLPEIYEEALNEQQEIRLLTVEEKQFDLLARLKAQGNTFFQSVETVVSSEQKRRWLTEFLIDAKRIRDAIKNPVQRTRNPGACSQLSSMRCEYKEACISETRDGLVLDDSIAPLLQIRKRKA